MPQTPRITIVAFGDSTTAGTPGWRSPVEAPPDGRGDVTSQYSYWLMRRHPEWDVANRGVNGERSDEIAGRFGRDVLAASPRAVIVIAGVNDVYQGQDADHVTDHLRFIYDQARRAGILVVAGSIVPYNSAGPDQNARMRAINTWIRAAAGRDGIAFADTRAAVAATGSPDRLRESPDGLHPSPSGYRLMADAIAPVLEALLTAGAPGAAAGRQP